MGNKIKNKDVYNNVLTNYIEHHEGAVNWTLKGFGLWM